MLHVASTVGSIDPSSGEQILRLDPGPAPTEHRFVHLTAEGDLSFVARIFDPQAAVTNPASEVTDPLTVGFSPLRERNASAASTRRSTAP